MGSLNASTSRFQALVVLKHCVFQYLYIIKQQSLAVKNSLRQLWCISGSECMELWYQSKV